MKRERRGGVTGKKQKGEGRGINREGEDREMGEGGQG